MSKSRPMSTPIPAAEIERDLRFAIEAAQAAGSRALHLRASGRWSGDMLADVGDQACDGYLQGLILGRYPDDGLLSEETADSPARLTKRRTWIVDPLDGTREFSELRADWAIHVALSIGGACALGAVALPAQERLMWAVSIAGHERAGLQGAGTLQRGDSAPGKPLRVAVSRSHTPAWTQRFAEALGGVLVHAGSVGNKVGLLLLGEADLYVHRKQLKEWDTCAPETIARALGWTVCKLHGEDHVYNRPNPVNDELVVCRPTWKERVLEKLRAVGAVDGA